MTKPSKLHCFHCGCRFGTDQIFRTLSNTPLCQDCIEDALECERYDPDYFLDTLAKEFNGKMTQMIKAFKMFECSQCGYEIWLRKDEIGYECPQCYLFTDLGDESNA